MTTSERLTALLADCRDDPALFNASLLGRPPYWSRQAEIGRSVVDYRATVACTGNAVGKDYLVGGLVPWWLLTRPGSLVIVTGPSQTLLGSVTWKEIRRACRPLSALGLSLSEGLRCSPLRLKVRGDWGALGFSTSSIERASGQHCRYLLVIVEEASGVDEEIWDAIDGLKYTRLLAIGNPVRPRGRFVELIRQAARDRREGVPPARAVNAVTIASTESPDAHLEQSPRGLADRGWLEDVRRRYGERSLWYRSHVLAETPSESSDDLIPEHWLDACLGPAPVRPPNDAALAASRWISIDLGEGVGRDETAVLVTDRMGVLDAAIGATVGLPEAAEHAARLKRRWVVPDERISYDRVGIGRDFANHLKSRGILGAVPYAGAGAARNKAEYRNLRTEGAWRLRERLDPERAPDPLARSINAPFHVPSAPWWPRLREDLAALTYELRGKQVQLISKEDLCAALGRSPDAGDALIQRFALCPS